MAGKQARYVEFGKEVMTAQRPWLLLHRID